MRKLHQKKALITGGTSGIGLAIAREFLSQGAEVVVCGRCLKEETIQVDERKAHFIQADVTTSADLDRVYQFVENKFGKLDILVVNAGIFKPTPLLQVDECGFDEIVNTNFKGAFFSVQKAIPHMNEMSSIIMISSISAKQGCCDFSVYNASKAAVHSLTQSFAGDLLSHKIRVNSITPGFIRTPLQDKLGINEEMIAACENIIPIKRFGQPEEIAKAALFLASDDSQYMNGAEMVIDGGILGVAPA